MPRMRSTEWRFGFATSSPATMSVFLLGVVPWASDRLWLVPQLERLSLLWGSDSAPRCQLRACDYTHRAFAPWSPESRSDGFVVRWNFYRNSGKTHDLSLHRNMRLHLAHTKVHHFDLALHNFIRKSSDVEEKLMMLRFHLCEGKFAKKNQLFKKISCYNFNFSLSPYRMPISWWLCCQTGSVRLKQTKAC